MMEHPENSEEYKGLQVNAGVEQVSIVNPYRKKNSKCRSRASVDSEPLSQEECPQT